MKKIIILSQVLVAMWSCKNDDATAEPGTVNLVFLNKVGAQALSLNSGEYTNQSGETYRVSELKYIISNIVFIADEGENYIVPQQDSYFVINQESSASLTVSIPEVDGKKYTGIRFGFGVDQTNYPLNGVNNFIPLAEENDMLWSWSAGYKFIKFEGVFSTDTSPEAPFLIHVGSHGTTLDNYKAIALSFPNAITVNANTQEVQLGFDIAKIFDAALQSFSLQDKSDIQVDPVYAPIIAQNIATAFNIEQ